MKRHINGLVSFRGTIITMVTIVLCLTAALSTSHASAAAASINIVNSSSRTICNVYLSHVDADDWGSDQLPENGTIASGGSFTISNVTWDQSQVKVIAEDQDGCFLSAVVTLNQTPSWTITNDTPADCGGGLVSMETRKISPAFKDWRSVLL